MDAREPVTADDLDAVVTCVVEGLRPRVDLDWSVPAGTLEWSCRDTTEHVGQALLHWSAQLAVRARTRYVRWVSKSPDVAPPAGVLEFLEGAGRILALVVRATPPDARAFHPHGRPDPEGYAGMGCIEASMHGYDIATGLGLELEPPPDVCERVLARMFPHYAPQLGTVEIDPWTALRWSAGRADVPGLPPVVTVDVPGFPPERRWGWRGDPLTEPWDPAPEFEPRPF